MTEMHTPPHPGEVLREWLVDISVTEAAKRLGVTRVALSRVLNGSAGVSADMDLRLSTALGTTPGSWYAMQANYDMWKARRHFRADPEAPMADVTVQLSDPEIEALKVRTGKRSSAAALKAWAAPKKIFRK